MQEFAQYHLNKSSNHELGTTDELLKGGTSKLLFEPMFFIFIFESANFSTIIKLIKLKPSHSNDNDQSVSGIACLFSH